MAGPTCPLPAQRLRPAPDRPLEGVTIVIRTGAGNQAGRTIDRREPADYGMTPPSGPYTIEPQPVQGMVDGSLLCRSSWSRA